MAHSDDAKNALATLKLAEAQRRTLDLLDAFLVLTDTDGEKMRDIRALIDAADAGARGVDNGSLRETEVKP